MQSSFDVFSQVLRERCELIRVFDSCTWSRKQPFGACSRPSLGTLDVSFPIDERIGWSPRFTALVRQVPLSLVEFPG